MNRNSFDFQKLLSMLAYLEQKGGEASIKELEELFGYDKSELKKIAKIICLCEVMPAVTFNLEIDEKDEKVSFYSPYDIRIPFALSEKELFAFLFALLAFKEYIGDANEDYKHLIDKIIGNLPKLLVEAVKKDLEKHRAVYPNREVFEVLNLISKAIKERKKIRISYYSTTSSRFGVHEVLPIQVNYYFKGFYLWAVDTADQLIKTFILENISDIEIIPETFNLDSKIENELKVKIEEFKKRRQDEMVTLKATGFSARYLSEMFQRFKKEELSDNEILFQVPLISIDWIVYQWLLPFSGEVSIVEPREIAEKARERIERILDIYK
ncbi:MAG: WYL domain-containing protein [Actinobacteria bacterium]|nr:WYL domain-containing protein [Actinomycetota bacterium]